MSLTAVREPENSAAQAGLRWEDRAACLNTDVEAFFPLKGGSTRLAKRVCSTCPVRRRCLEYALVNREEHGVWGGKSEPERRKILRARAKRAEQGAA